MQRIVMAILAFGLISCFASAQQAPSTTPKPAQSPAPKAAPATGTGQAPTTAPGPLTAQTPAPESAFKTQKDKLSYALGMQMGKGLMSEGVEIDPAVVLQGLNDALSASKSQMSEEELRQVMTGLQQQIQQKRAQVAEAAAAENKKKGEEFLAANGKKAGVVVLPDGLQYKVVTAGQGKKPAETDTVLCNYKGTFIDGTEFDSSARAGKPVPFQVKGVIPGFKEVLQMMPVGSKWQVFIPSSLAYGERGVGTVIGPNTTLVFEIELVGIQTEPAPAAAPAKETKP